MATVKPQGWVHAALELEIPNSTAAKWITRMNNMSRLLSSLALLLIVFSFHQSASASGAFDLEASGLDVGIGYRTDQFDWNISGTDSDESQIILSELSWEDLQIVQLQATGWLEFGKLPLINRHSLVFADVSFGKIVSGNVQDSDYASAGRKDEWSRSVNDASEGMTADLSAAFGPIFEFNNVAGFSITPLFGYGFNMQALTMSNGNQVISEPSLRPDGPSYPPDLGSLQGLDSSYTAYWYGPWLGTNIDYQANDKFKLRVGGEYHWVDYFAQADWNLRADFKHPVSFEHEATGTGIVWKLQGQYWLNEKWSWLFSGNIQTWETESGSDRTFLTDGSVGLSRLNQVNWDSYALTTGVQYRF